MFGDLLRARCHVIDWRENLLTIIVFDASNAELPCHIILKGRNLLNLWKSLWSNFLQGREWCFREKMILVYLIFWLKMIRFTLIWKKRKLLDFTLYVHFENEALFSFFRGYTSARNHIDDKYYKYTGSNNDNCCPSESMLRLFLQNSSKRNGRRPVLLRRNVHSSS